MKRKFQDFWHIANSNNKFLIIGHLLPDGDAIASALSLCHFLESLGKRADIVFQDEIPEVFRFLPEIEKIKKDAHFTDYEVVILADCSQDTRTGFAEQIEQFLDDIKLVVIDHHSNNNLLKRADVSVLDIEAAATAQIIYRFLNYFDIDIPQKVASWLLAGIYTDTGGFRHSNTSTEILKIVSDLLGRGARIPKIVNHIELCRPVDSMKLWGRVLLRARRHNQLPLVTSYVSQKDMDELGANYDDLSGVVNLLNVASETKAALLLYEAGDGIIKGSLRTENNDIDVSCFAEFFGGGGHKKAAGFSLAGRIVKTKDQWGVKINHPNGV